MTTQYGGMGRTAFNALFDALDMGGAPGTDEVSFHSHECPKCGAEWGHADDTPERVTRAQFMTAHSCPKCGTEQRYKAQHGLTREQCAALPDGIR
jgi:predicted RNA-binding Zn-ribbon protein involved in translation (DUF1610 family)